MCKQVKSLLIIISLSFILAGLTVTLYLIDPDFEVDIDIITSMILVTVWAFFLPSSLIFSIKWAKEYFDKLTFEQSFRIGYLLGRGWGALAFLLFLALSPIVGVIWFAQTVKEIRLALKDKRKLSKKIDSNDDIFDM